MENHQQTRRSSGLIIVEPGAMHTTCNDANFPLAFSEKGKLENRPEAKQNRNNIPEKRERMSIRMIAQEINQI
jgi:hypothetical protein